LLNFAIYRFTPLDGLPALDAAMRARWIAQGRCDTGRPLKLLDTRIDFEVDAGACEATAGQAPGWQGRCFVFDERTGLHTRLAA
jgi:predicted sulfurtransferase